MSRRRKPGNTQVERPNLQVKIFLKPDGSVEIDPQFNKLAIKHFDQLYLAAGREDYESTWTDDHKVAFFLMDMIDGVLAQWVPADPQDGPQDHDPSIPAVPHIREAPVRDRFDLNGLGRANPSKMPN